MGRGRKKHERNTGTLSGGCRFFLLSFFLLLGAWEIFLVPFPGFGEVPQAYIPRYARGFSVEPYAGGWHVSVRDPGDSTRAWNYLLVSRRELPKGEIPSDWTVLPVPLERVVLLATPYVTGLEDLGVLDSVVGVGNVRYLHSPALRRRLKEGKALDAGNDLALDLERLVALRAEGLFWYAPYEEVEGQYRNLRNLALPLVVTTEHLENHPLGRGEWLVFLGFFFGKEKEARSLFEERERRYRELAALGASVAVRPTVFGGYPFGDTWYMPGGGELSGPLRGGCGRTLSLGGPSGIFHLASGFRGGLFPGSSGGFLDQRPELEQPGGGPEGRLPVRAFPGLSGGTSLYQWGSHQPCGRQ